MHLVKTILQRLMAQRLEGLSTADAIACFESYRTADHRYHLPGLDVAVSVQPTECIMDCGFVESIADHTRALLREWHCPTDDGYLFGELGLPEKWRDRGTKGGNCWSMRFPEGRVLVVLRYVLTDDPILDTVIRGHEETHALQKLGQIPVLESLVNEARSAQGEISCDFSLLYEEGIAQVGGLIAAYRHGYNPHEHRERILRRFSSPYRSVTAHAYQSLPKIPENS